MKNKGWGCLIIFLVLALIASVGFNVLQMVAKFGMEEASLGGVQPKTKYTEHLEQEGDQGTKERIVRIDVEGIIGAGEESSLLSAAAMDVDGIKTALEQAVTDSNVKAIVLRVNSPGGEVTASDTLYRAVKETSKSKPVVVYMDSMAASGGYYLSCGSTLIVANETTLTGSIGVIMETLNYGDAMNKLGLGMMTFKSGAFKDTLSGARPMRDDEKAYIQGLVMEMYDKFVGIVADARHLGKDQLKATLADGRVFTGGEALKNHLVDQLGYIEDAYAQARTLGKAPKATVVRYQKRTGLGELLFGAAANVRKPSASNELHINLRDSVPHLKPGTMYMLPDFMLH